MGVKRVSRKFPLWGTYFFLPVCHIEWRKIFIQSVLANFKSTFFLQRYGLFFLIARARARVCACACVCNNFYHILIFRFPKLSDHVQWDSAMRKMGIREKKANMVVLNFPNNNFKTLGEFGRYLDSNPESLKYHKKKLNPNTEDFYEGSAIKVKVVKSSSKHEHVIFYDEELLKKFTDNENFIDGTFKSRPNVKGCAQLLTILGRCDGIVSTTFLFS